MMLKTLLLCTAVGISAAFFRPAQPHQAPAAIVEIPRGGAFSFEAAQGKPFIDDDLDNFYVEADDAITAARKCGFCMVRIALVFTHLDLKILILSSVSLTLSYLLFYKIQRMGFFIGMIWAN